MPASQVIRFAVAPDGVRLAYAIAAESHGPPLVKIGTWMSHLEFDRASPVWGHLLDWLAQRFTLLRYDQRATGMSDWDVAEISFEAWVRDLECVLDAAGLRRVALLGLSQGAPVALAFAVRHPERVSHLVLHGGYARGRRKRGTDPAEAALDDMVVRMIELGWGREEPSFRQFFTSTFVPEGTPEQHRWFNELERVSASPANAARMLRTMYDIDVTASLAAVQGRDNAQIGAVLGLSDKTVRNHITSVFAKLAVENRPQAIVRARSAGLGQASRS